MTDARGPVVRGTTRLVGLIGDPVSHSLSPPMQNAAFAAVGLDLVYVPLRVPAERLDAGLGGLVAQRVYDEPPQNRAFPYVELGTIQTLPDRADCVEGSESFLTLHAWSRGVGMVETRRVIGAVRDALQDAELALEGHRLNLLEFQDARTLDDPDGLTKHGVLTFRALTHAIQP